MFSVFKICIVCVCRKIALDSLLTLGCGAAKFHAMLVALATHEKGTSMPHKAWHQPFCFRIHLHPKGCQIIKMYQNIQTDVS